MMYVDAPFTPRTKCLDQSNGDKYKILMYKKNVLYHNQNYVEIAMCRFEDTYDCRTLGTEIEEFLLTCSN